MRHGNRVCLIYNLIQKRSKGRRRILKAPEYEHPITEAAAILDRFLKAPDAPAKIAWLLDHQYSPAGLSFSALKGAMQQRPESLSKRQPARNALRIWDRPYRRVRRSRAGRRLLLQFAPESLRV